MVTASRSRWRRGSSTWSRPATTWPRSVGSSRGAIRSAISSIRARDVGGRGGDRRGRLLRFVVTFRGRGLLRFVVVGLQQLQVAEETAPDAGGKPGNSLRVAERLVEELADADEVGLPVGDDARQAESTGADRDEVRAPVGVAGDLSDLGKRPDGRERDARAPGLAARAEADDAERRPAREAVGEQGPVARLEDVERQRRTGHQDDVERKERDLHHPAVRARGGRARMRRRRPAATSRRAQRETPPVIGGVVAGGGEAGIGRPEAQWQAPGEPADSAVRKDEPQPQAETAFGLLTVKPAPMSVST